MTRIIRTFLIIGSVVIFAMAAGGCTHSKKGTDAHAQDAAAPPVYRGAPVEENDLRTVTDITKDTGITNVIRARLLADEHVSARRIIVHTTRGTVALSGVVTSTTAHDRAVAIARSTPGVTAVYDGLTIITP